MSAALPPPLAPEVPDLSEDADSSQAGPGPAPAAVSARWRPSRRAVIKASAGAGLLLLIGGWIQRALLRAGPPAAGHQILSVEELAVADAIGLTFFPGPPEMPMSAQEVDLGAFADQYVANLYPDQQRLMRLLLRTLNLWPLLRYGHTFTQLGLEERRSVLEGWQMSKLTLRRAGYQSLRFIYALGYFEDFRVRRMLGFKFGCDLSGRFPELSMDEAG